MVRVKQTIMMLEKTHTLTPSSNKKKKGYPDAPIERNSTEAHALLGKWDLGTRRTLNQLIEFTGVDTRKKEVGVCGYGCLNVRDGRVSLVEDGWV